MPEFRDYSYLSSTGKNIIRGLLCVPEGEKRGIVQISHGIGDHSERYRDFMSFLAGQGYLVAANDHLGHGKSIASEEEKGFFAEEDGWNYVVEDMKLLHDRMKEEYPDLPYILFGHSMGSFLSRTYVIRFPEDLDALILSGTGQQSALLVKAGLFLANREVKKKGPRASGALLNKIAFGSYLKKIPDAKTAFDWLTRDEEIVQKYVEDPLCGFVAAASLYRDMMWGIRFISQEENLARMKKELPVFFVSGDGDPVGDYGAGVDKAAELFRKAGMQDISIQLYSGGRHEMLNELNRREVYEDILSWIREKVHLTPHS